MLKPAILYRDTLCKLWTENIASDRLKFLTPDCWIDFELKIATTTWDSLQYACVAADGEVYGYLKAGICRQDNTASNLVFASLTGDHGIEFAQDMQAFMSELLAKFYKVKWSVVVGNPAEPIYDMFATRNGGQIAGVYRDDALLTDGKRYDLKVYEILTKRGA